MVKKLTQYETTDGKTWDSYNDAKKHEERIGAKSFDSADEMWKYIQKTTEWNEWLRRYREDSEDVFYVEEEARKVGRHLERDYPTVVITRKFKGKNIEQTVNWSDFIWIQFEKTVMINYFKSQTEVKISVDKIEELYQLAKRESYSSSLHDVVNSFENLITVANIILG